MAEDEKLKKLRESIEKPQPKESESRRPEGMTARPEELDKIIERLRAREDGAATREKQSLQEARLTELKERIEGKASTQKLDFSRAIAQASAGGSKQQVFSDSALSFVGGFYSLFELPVSSIASAFSRLPLAHELEANLASAGLAVSVETYLVTTSVLALIVGIMLLALSFSLSLLFAPQFAFIAIPISILAFILAGVLMLAYPAQTAGERARRLNKELPFALRHLSSQIKAGVSFHRALKSVASADYGLLSVEFKRVLRDLDKGASTESALSDLAARTKSVGLRKAMVQIIRALKTGGNLSEIISSIAEDVSFESRALVRDFVEMLNIVNVMYIMVGVVAPVVITILSAVAQLPMLGLTVDFSMVVLVFVGDIMAMLGMVYIIFRMEPE
ncbi:MAG: type II secretion system F family protein [Candidatus Micrarchaeia archaeon]